MLLALLFAGMGSALAHHSAAMFDTKQEVTLAGTVREFQWISPHCYIQLVVAGEEGEEEWSLEMGAPMYLYRLGWRPGTLKPGDAVTVRVSPLRTGAKGGLVLDVTTPDGTRLGRKP